MISTQIRMISCTAEARETQPCSTGGVAGVLLRYLDNAHGWRTTELRKQAGCSVVQGGGGIHHDQCILVDDMNHVAAEGEGRMDAEEAQGGGNICRCACVIVDKLNHGGSQNQKPLIWEGTLNSYLPIPRTRNP